MIIIIKNKKYFQVTVKKKKILFKIENGNFLKSNQKGEIVQKYQCL